MQATPHAGWKGDNRDRSFTQSLGTYSFAQRGTGWLCSGEADPLPGPANPKPI